MNKDAFLSLLGPVCVLIGLAEILRLIFIYSLNHGIFIGFPLEISIYLIGITWTINNYIKNIQEKIPTLNNLMIKLKKTIFKL